MSRNNAALILVVLLGLLWTGMPGIARGGHLEPFKALPVGEVNPLTPAKVELGKRLFFDRRLSGDGTMSCVTCHMPDMGFSDGQAISLNYPTTRNWRNSPTLINVGFNTFLFHDGRVDSLEDQALFPMMSAFEMNQNLDYLEEEIRSVPEYVAEFKAVFGTDAVTRERIAMAIAAFERTLVSRNAPLDRFLAGDARAMSDTAREGYTLFTGKGRCTDCHYGVNLNDNKFHALNVPEHPHFQDDPRVVATRRFVAKLNHFDDYLNLQEDPGRYLITKKEEDWRAFKTPTLREIAKTGPYMHNGIFESLEEVIEFHNVGGGPGNKALKPLGLSSSEIAALKVFLTEALAGEDIVIKSPLIP